MLEKFNIILKVWWYVVGFNLNFRIFENLNIIFEGVMNNKMLY